MRIWESVDNQYIPGFNLLFWYSKLIAVLVNFSDRSRGSPFRVLQVWFGASKHWDTWRIWMPSNAAARSNVFFFSIQMLLLWRYYLIVLRPAPTALWVSGSADGIGAENSWSWCPSGIPIMKNASWSGGAPTNVGTVFNLKISWSYLAPLTLATVKGNTWAFCEVCIKNFLNPMNI